MYAQKVETWKTFCQIYKTRATTGVSLACLLEINITEWSIHEQTSIAFAPCQLLQLSTNDC